MVVGYVGGVECRWGWLGCVRREVRSIRVRGQGVRSLSKIGEWDVGSRMDGVGEKNGYLGEGGVGMGE